MAKNRSHLALAKFAQAEKLAPNWGRLQLKWGQALAYARQAGGSEGEIRPRRHVRSHPVRKVELAGMRP